MLCGAASRSSQRRAAVATVALAAAISGAKLRLTRERSGTNSASIQPATLAGALAEAHAKAPARSVRRMRNPSTCSTPEIARCAMNFSSRNTSNGARYPSMMVTVEPAGTLGSAASPRKRLGLMR